MIIRQKRLSRLFGFGLRLVAIVLAATLRAETPLTQDFLVHNWDLDEGLPSTCVNSVVRTPDGYVWLGTRHGLARFDGLHFVVFNMANQPALLANEISCLATNLQGALLIGTDNGTLTTYEHGTFTSVDIHHAAHGFRISSIVSDNDGNLWLATDGAGIISVKSGQLENNVTTIDLPSPHVWQLLAAPTGRLWYVAAPGVLGWVEAGKGHLSETVPPLPPVIRSIALAREGGLWLALRKDWNNCTQIFKLKDGQVTEPAASYPWPQNTWRSRPGALLEDPAGNLWLGTLGAGLFYHPPNGDWQKLVADPAFSQAEVVCLVEDESSSIWIGTRTSGLHQCVLQPLTAFMLPMANAQNVVLTTAVRHDGSVWAGTDGAGVFRWQDLSTNRVGEPQGLGGLQVNALLEDSRGKLWAGTSEGLFYWQHGGFSPATNPAGPGPVHALYENSRGKLWAGTAGGLVCFNDPGQHAFTNETDLPHRSILDILEAADGRLWVALQNLGVYRQNGGHFEPWSPKAGAPKDLYRWGTGGRARSLVADPDGSLWVATYGDGLFHLVGDRIRNWTWENDGLPSNHQFALRTDAGGNLWFSCENGIVGYSQKVLLDYQAGQPPPVPWRLTQADGLPLKVCSGFSQPVAARSWDGRMWFPDGAAVVAFDPAAIPNRNPHTWPPIIEEVRVDGRSQPRTAAGALRILSGVRSVEIYFTSPNILSPNHLHFRYQMEGLDKEWVEAGSRRSAEYSQLPPGDYAFRVMVADDRRVWNSRDAVLVLAVVHMFGRPNGSSWALPLVCWARSGWESGRWSAAATGANCWRWNVSGPWNASVPASPGTSTTIWAPALRKWPCWGRWPGIIPEVRQSCVNKLEKYPTPPGKCPSPWRPSFGPCARKMIPSIVSSNT